MSLTDLLEFPCEFPIKALGYSSQDFDVRMVEIVRRYSPDLGEGAVSSRPSRNGKYTAITITIRAIDEAQLEAIYRELSACDEVVMVL